MVLGPWASSKAATLPSSTTPTPGLLEGTVSRAICAESSRNERSARSHTSYCWSASLYLLTGSPPTSTLVVDEIAWIDTPSSLARSRFGTIRTSGLRNERLVSTSTKCPSAFIHAQIFSE